MHGGEKTMYEVVMPQLSDSMDEGKLISWKVNVGDHVKSGDVIAEVESDKAIMEVETFKDGVIGDLLVKEGESAKVGSVIATINTQETQISASQVKKENSSESQKVEQKSEKKDQNILEDIFYIESETPEKKEEQISVPKVEHTPNSQKGISPKARAQAAVYGVDLNDLFSHTQKDTLHEKDLQNYLLEHYFTPKAQKILQEYQLDFNVFELDHKIDERELLSYIQKHEIALPKALTSMQKAIISNVEASAKKPIFHIYESGDAGLLEEHKEKSITVWLIKIIAKVMMQHETFRSQLLRDAMSVMPNASISLAVAHKKDLYMPVIKDANTLEIDAIEKQLQIFKTKLQKRSFTSQEMQGSTFGISNLGMLGVERFDAMINRDDTAILAVGAVKEGKISLTLTADHRLINGYEAALFMADLLKELQNPLNFKLDL